MGYIEQAALAVDEVFRGRVRVALATAAKDVMGEDPTGYTGTVYGKRQNLAYSVLQNAAGGSFLDSFVWAVVANPAITDVSSDSDIQFTVNSLWGDLSGVKVGD